MAGDFNFVENPYLDRNKGCINKDAPTQRAFADILAANSLIDVYRLRHPKVLETTHTHLPTQPRLDRIYIDKRYIKQVTNFSHEFNSFTDHKAVTISIKFIGSLGLGYWKCNVSILDDQDFKADLKALWKFLTENSQNSAPSLEWWDSCVFSP
jgi:hypothetical protein